MNNNYELFESIFTTTDELLWKTYENSNNSKLDFEKCKLIFPKYKNKSSNNLRVSEQEARFIFSKIIENTSFYYSIETPTENDYQQKGKGKRSAATDMTLYDKNKLKLLNIEFKSGTISTSAKNSFPIKKDIEKLISEKVFGCWFHILKSVDNKSLEKLLTTFKRDIEEVKKEIKINNSFIIFHICVLNQNFSITTKINISNIPEKFNKVKYKVTRNKLLEFNDEFWKLYDKKNSV